MQAAAGAAGVAVIVDVPLGTGVNGTVVRFWLYAEKPVPFTPVPNGTQGVPWREKRLRVVAAAHGDHAGTRELADAVGAEEVLHGVQLAGDAGGLDGERVLAHVDHLGTEDVGDLYDLVASLGEAWTLKSTSSRSTASSSVKSEIL